MPKTDKPKRVSLNCSLSPEIANQLQRESRERMLNASLLVENALAAYLPTLPPLNGNEPG